ncbi:MAG: hypothetical protein P4L33_02585 [Capsulimonadaceae bacterium]|nr:hypothetical protein [Capsulimonadaceae bacterium]
MRWSLVCATLFLAVGIIDPSYADTPTFSPLYSTVPFDTTAPRLPAGFAGADIQAIWSAATKLSPIKDEFETTEEFNQRVAGFAHAKVADNLSVSDCLSFRVISEKVSSTYDADSHILTVSIRPYSFSLHNANSIEQYLREIGVSLTEHDFSYYSTDAYFIGCLLSSIDGGTYTAQNAYGTQFTVRRQNYSSYELYIKNIANYHVAPTDGTLTVASIPLSADDARIAKPDISVLALCHFSTYKSDYCNENNFIRRPTANDPIEYTLKLYVLHTVIDAFWVYNKSTGDVYSRLIPSESSH